MIDIELRRSLRDRNTFGFDQAAERYAEVPDEERLAELLEYAERRRWPVFVLGGGSNIVLTRDIPGLTVRLTDKHLSVASPKPTGATRVAVGAGHDWHELVRWTTAHGLHGLENLSLIPGTVGAAPVQNIGAYGVELAERLLGVRAWHRPERRFLELDNDDCRFAYRDSLFKRERGEWIITRVDFELGPHLPIETGYASLAERLKASGIVEPTAADVARSVVAIRQERLPDPTVIGNAGSFFHNPVVTAEQASALLERFPDVIHHSQPDGQVKLSGGWLIDQLRFRGWRENGVGVHDRQALVLINEGRGTGAALMALAERIRDAVRTRYGVELTTEPLVL